jgi:hypothetical protein
VPVETLVKRHGNDLYVFAVTMRPGETTATFQLNDGKAGGPIEVLGESRTVSAANGQFQDTFNAWDVHLYRMVPQ